MRAWQIPLRLATGAFILNSGLDTLRVDAQGAEHLHGVAGGAYPVVKRLEPDQFATVLSAAEIVVGATLLSPFVSSATAGLALGGFSGTLLGLYWKTPGLHRDGDPRPTPDGVAMAKDVWMAGSAAALLIGSIGGSRRAAKARAKARGRAQARREAAIRAAAAKPGQLAAAAARPVRRAV